MCYNVLVHTDDKLSKEGYAMIQDIYPARLNNSYKCCTPSDGDALMLFDGCGRLYTSIDGSTIILPKYGEIPASGYIYLFSVDDTGYFMAVSESTIPGYEYRTVRDLRNTCTGKELFAAFTAYHLWGWYSSNKFCGKCGNTLALHESERALRCSCGNVIYPRINPAVIVGVINADKLLITRYRTGYAHNALVAGFTEIGETLEQTVEREVMEETGIKVKNITYYKSQPWGTAQDLLVGFFCEAQSSDIRMDTYELKYAEWVERDRIIPQPTDVSLTNEMMKVFIGGYKLG